MIILAPHPVFTQAIVLPSPEWQDNSVVDNSVKILRAMGGGYWTYVRKSDILRLEYSLVLTSEKARELKDFYKEYTGYAMQLESGDVYIGTLEQEPLTVTNDRRGVYDLSLEVCSTSITFLGVKQ
jgi:hypothetical protein